VSALYLPNLVCPEYCLGSNHIALQYGRQIEITRLAEEGGPIDFTMPQASVSCSSGIACVLFANNDEFLLVGQMPGYYGDRSGKTGGVSVHDPDTGETIFEVPYQRPYRREPGDEKAPWESNLALSSDNMVYGVTVIRRKRPLWLLQDMVSGRGLSEPITPASHIAGYYGKRAVVPRRGLVAWVRVPAVLEVWQLPARRLVFKEDLPAVPATLCFSPDGHYLVAVAEDKTKVRIYSFAAEDMQETTHGAATRLAASLSSAGRTSHGTPAQPKEVDQIPMQGGVAEEGHGKTEDVRERASSGEPVPGSASIEEGKARIAGEGVADLWLEEGELPAALSRETPLIKLLADELQWDMMDCRVRLGELPAPLVRQISASRARELAAKLTTVGARACVRPAAEVLVAADQAVSFDPERFRTSVSRAGWSVARVHMAATEIQTSLEKALSSQECLEAWDAIGPASQALVRKCYAMADEFTIFAFNLLNQSPCPPNYVLPLYCVVSTARCSRCDGMLKRAPTPRAKITLGPGVTPGMLSLYAAVVCTSCARIECMDCKGSPADAPCSWCHEQVSPANRDALRRCSRTQSDRPAGRQSAQLN